MQKRWGPTQEFRLSILPSYLFLWTVKAVMPRVIKKQKIDKDEKSVRVLIVKSSMQSYRLDCVAYGRGLENRSGRVEKYVKWVLLKASQAWILRARRRLKTHEHSRRVVKESFCDFLFGLWFFPSLCTGMSSPWCSYRSSIFNTSPTGTWEATTSQYYGTNRSLC